MDSKQGTVKKRENGFEYREQFEKRKEEGKNMGVKTRKALDKMPNYIMAKSLEAEELSGQAKDIVKLAGNENRLGCSPKVFEAITDYKDSFFYYPDMNCIKLRPTLAKKLSVDPDQLIFGNGSFELLSLLTQTFLEEGEESIIAQPSFGWYKNVTLQMGAEIIEVPLRDFKIDLEGTLKAITEKTKIIWICNPLNPIGSLLEKEKLLSFIKQVRNDILIVLDEAYIEFTENPYFNTLELIDAYENIISLRTFSKLYGLAGLRIGYGIANKNLLLQLQKVKIPPNVNAIAQIAALASLQDEDFPQKVLDNNKKGLALYYETLDKWNLSYIRSNGNFIFLDTGKDSVVVEEYFIKKGVIIRGGYEFGFPTWLRISIGTYEENKEALEVLREFLKK
ncbi:histidinol-phosphate transaminase [Lachnospiraceae bacterium ZAX-1]